MKNKTNKVLIVDDSKSSAILLEYMVKQLNLEFKTVSDGEIAIKENLHEYDVVFMDIEMPVMNGLETTKYIRDKLLSDIPIVAVTSHNPEDFDELRAYGFTYMLSKPIHFEGLKLLIKNI